MRVVVIGDVGVVDGMLHAGDEAMFDALVEALLARGAGSIVGVSNAPAETADRYGIEAVGGIGFSGGRADMQARFDLVLRCSAGERVLPAEDPVWSVIDAVSGFGRWPSRAVATCRRRGRCTSSSAPHSARSPNAPDGRSS